MSMQTENGTEDILHRARALLQDSEQAYEEFLEAWGLDRDALGRAARGEHIRPAGRRRVLERALEHVDLPDTPPLPGIPGVETRTPPHGIRC